MPPEALTEGAKYDEKLDIYSFGILLSEMILRTHPSEMGREVRDFAFI
jgi:hypothetical protein